MIIPNYFEDLHILRKGTQPDHAYFIPASRRMDDLVEQRETSDRFQLLNGEWRFHFWNSPYDVKDTFYEIGFMPENWDTVPVPAVWQNLGYDGHHYTNNPYPFPVDPPYVPYENPCGTYIHKFEFSKDPAAPETFLTLEGVDSCCYVWLNGSFLGYDQVSHSATEFRVTETIRDGENTLAVLVLKWCDGSYLEDQDKFRHTGIFRDVYLVSRPERFVRDYFVNTELGQKEALVRICMDHCGEPVPAKIKVLNAADEIVAEAIAEKETAFTVSDPILWNPEQPYLYTLLIETPGEVITDRVGLRKISIQNNTVLLNGQPIKFRGINRHDSDPVTGPVISVSHMKRDLKLMRENNFNAIRTSHYPNAPMFCQLCDQYGFLVIAEADNESHGAKKLYCADNKNPASHEENWNVPFADNPDFLEPTLDRVKRCVQRDKNRPSVVIWSMGNECAYGCCFEAALAWTKGFDPSRLTHYEGAQHHSSKRKYDFSNIDLYSDMYPSIQKLQAYVDGSPDKPFILCEYSHAMGNGPGDLEDYWQFIQAHDCMCGGFVWEWCDHAVYKGIAENGKAMYWYGGDHGEYPHLGNFCMDGLVYPDRTPHTGLLEFKNVHRPARVVRLEGDRLTLHNYMDFVDLDQYLTMGYEITCDGETVGTGTVDAVPAIAPHKEGVLRLPLSVPGKGRCYLKLSYYLKKAEALLPAGFPLGFDEVPLQNADSRNQKAAQLCREEAHGVPVCAEENDRFITVTGGQFVYRYDKFKGAFSEMTFREHSLLNRPMEWNIWRAPTDNDRKLKLQWFDAHYDRSVTRGYRTACQPVGNTLQIITELSFCAVTLQPCVRGQIRWTVTPAGAVIADIRAKRDMVFPQLPRFGLRLFLPKSMESVSYYGLGPMENYPDKRAAAYHGSFQTTVTELHEDYIRPQENGSHSDCDFVTLESDTLRLTAAAQETFSFNASRYTQEELTHKAHNYELTESDSTVLCLDYRQNGIGSGSCGPELLPRYRLDEENIAFTIRLIPEIK